MGRLGAQRGASHAVKTFSQMLITDHSKANSELEALAKRKGLTWPPDDAQVASSLPLAKKSGAEFDREFARVSIEDHEKDIAAFEKEIKSGSDPDVKSWAERTLPTLRAHLASARTLPKE
jgi:putative membrane protein